ncbi:MAG: hypothetical protein IPK33_03105 [Gemmatimonadetes bacterium]|nr:hypothetical protein [Gemmatimonadota bacterium]
MPVVKVTRTGVTAAPRDVPTDTTATVLPMTIDRVGQEAPEDELPAKVTSIAEAFKTFKPAVDFRTQVGEDGTEFVAQLEFNSLKDFDPKQIRTRTPGKRNDIADLHNRIELLQRMRESFSLLPVRRAWDKTGDRAEIMRALKDFTDAVQRIADGKESAK